MQTSTSRFFPMARFEHVQVDPQMRGKECLSVEGRFAGPLQANENDGFHKSTSAFCSVSEATPLADHSNFRPAYLRLGQPI